MVLVRIQFSLGRQNEARTILQTVIDDAEGDLQQLSSLHKIYVVRSRHENGVLILAETAWILNQLARNPAAKVFARALIDKAYWCYLKLSMGKFHL